MQNHNPKDGITSSELKKEGFAGSTLTKRGITGSTLKIIAMVTMLIDHVTYVLLPPIISRFGMSVSDIMAMLKSNNKYCYLYLAGRLIGRIAFPIYCFLLVEGFKYTRSRLKYGIRLFVFGLVSEIPFDLAFRKSLFAFDYQNVFFTLLIGFIAICLIEKAKELNMGEWPTYFAKLAIILVTCLLAAFLQTDYSYTGVLAIVLINEYMNRGYVWGVSAGTIFLTITNLFEVTALLDILLIKFYNGKRGLNVKYLFYAFYPAHLLVLYVIYKTYY